MGLTLRSNIEIEFRVGWAIASDGFVDGLVVLSQGSLGSWQN